MYSGALLLTILSIIAIGAGITFLGDGPDYYGNTISVTGSAEVSSEPDVATFSFTIQETAETTKEAQRVISEKVANALDTFDGLDIPEKDIKTESYTMHPKYEWVTVTGGNEKVSVDGEIYVSGNRGKNVQVGFDVSQNISLTVRDFEIVPDVLDALGSIGVENLYGPNFEIEDPESLQDQARELAIEKAKAKAKKLAKDLDVKLGDIVSFEEGGNGGYYPEPMFGRSDVMMLSGAMEESFSPELPTGENEILKEVTIIYELK